tara:strand:+ start:10428 stop:10895 length:468 start_codon:yes stop_codon:yes gene_type:complete
MFSLIISIIAIALVAAIALASIYYGGDAFQQGTVEANSSTLLNQAQQVQGAVVLSKIDNEEFNTMSELVPSYLKEVPQFEGTAWKTEDAANVFEAKAVVMELAAGSDELCSQIQENVTNNTTIQTAADSDSLATPQIKGCFVDSTDSKQYVFFKI